MENNFNINLDNELSVMTFNILFENPIEIFKPKQNSWKNRKDSVSNLLQIYNADIICLQECVITQLLFLKEQLKEKYLYFGAKANDQINFHWSDINPIFYKKDRFQYIDGGTFWYSEFPLKPNSSSYGNTIPRTFTWALLMDMKNIQNEKIINILVISTHLDVFSRESREKSVCQLLKFLETLNFEYDFIFLAGDFNSLEGCNHLNKLLDDKLHNLVDSNIWAADEYNKKMSTFNGFYGDTGRRIDYIFYGDKNNLIINGEYKVIDDISDTNTFVSDHYPVLLKLNYKNI